MEIVRTSLFERSLKKLGASAADLQRLETEIAFNPTVGDVIQGLRGARKARFSMAGRGKSGEGVDRWLKRNLAFPRKTRILGVT
jgi:hypothetical protein